MCLLRARPPWWRGAGPTPKCPSASGPPGPAACSGLSGRWSAGEARVVGAMCAPRMAGAPRGGVRHRGLQPLQALAARQSAASLPLPRAPLPTHRGKASVPLAGGGEIVVGVNSAVPVAVIPGVRFARISVGLLHACGIEARTARVVCWGVRRGCGGMLARGDAGAAPLGRWVGAGCPCRHNRRAVQARPIPHQSPAAAPPRAAPARPGAPAALQPTPPHRAAPFCTPLHPTAPH